MLAVVNRALRLLGILGLIIVMQAWGTSACLFADVIRSVAGVTEDAGASTVPSQAICCCCRGDVLATAAENDAAVDTCRLGGENCPLCTSIGNSHELVPLSAGPSLPVASTLCVERIVLPTRTHDTVSRDVVELLVIPRPGPIAFCTTVALLR